MSEALREQRPLLCEDLSEEEHFPEFPRRYRPVYRARAKSTAKGATAIITRWPEHWSSTFTYWWIGLSMMALTIFAIYNVVIAFVLLPTVNMKLARLRAPNETDFNVPSHLPEIFMHFFVNTDDKTDLNKYIPYIESVSNKYLDYNFNLILLLNDTAHEAIKYSAEENNEIALNSLWSKEHDVYNRKQKSHKNIKIREVALSQFMNESPLKSNWRRIPSHFMAFLVKAITIWEKGGIAINFEILMPRSPSVMYVEKFQHILNKFKKQKDNVPNEIKLKKIGNKRKDKFKKKVNNIRDIINILEREDNSIDSQENLTEAENVNSPVAISRRQLLSTTLQAPKNKSKLTSPTVIELPKVPLMSSLNDTESSNHYLGNVKFHNEMDTLEVVNEGFEILDESNESKLSLLPMFLELLFHDKPKVNVADKKQEADNLVRHRKSTIRKDKIKKNANTPISIPVNKTETKADEKYKPMIISAKGIVPDQPLKINEPKTIETSHEVSDELTIDLKGNILATKISCHAFIGTVFNNVIHHPPEETLQDFIIAQLSLFCKGLLSSCRGIDVILV